MRTGIGTAKVAGAIVAFLMAGSASDAQQLPKTPRIGILTLSVASSTPTFEGFRQGLQEHGYVEGRNIGLEFRYVQGAPEKLPAMAIELAKMKVDVIVTESILAAVAAKQATATIPIVMAVNGDPLEAGLVASLARPGGNITGLSLLAPEISGKRLQLLKEVNPKITHVAVILNGANPASARYLAETQAAARSLGLQIQVFDVRSPPDFDMAFKAMTNAPPSAIVTSADGTLLASKVRIIDFAAKNRLPAIFPDRELAEAGGLMTYGPSLSWNFRRAAAYMDKILKGADPGDLPIEQATQFLLVINLNTAKALNLVIPPLVLQRADEIIR